MVGTHYIKWVGTTFLAGKVAMPMLLMARARSSGAFRKVKRDVRTGDLARYTRTSASPTTSYPPDEIARMIS
jgi:hypothetical protein